MEGKGPSHSTDRWKFKEFGISYLGGSVRSQVFFSNVTTKQTQQCCFCVPTKNKVLWGVIMGVKAWKSLCQMQSMSLS